MRSLVDWLDWQSYGLGSIITHGLIESLHMILDQMVILDGLPSLDRTIGRTLQTILCDQAGTQESVLLSSTCTQSGLHDQIDHCCALLLGKVTGWVLRLGGFPAVSYSWVGLETKHCGVTGFAP